MGHRNHLAPDNGSSHTSSIRSVTMAQGQNLLDGALRREQIMCLRDPPDR